MFEYVVYSIFVIVVLVIIALNCYEIRCIMKQKRCSLKEAIKIYAATFHVNEEDDWPITSSSNNDDERFSPAYKFLPYNIHHYSYDD